MFDGLRRGQVQFHAGCVGITKIGACAGALAHFFHDLTGAAVRKAEGAATATGAGTWPRIWPWG